ncbi:MAG: glycosyltransferase [Planctomycetota bacterium]
MRVAHVVHQFAPESHGGLESYVLDLALGQVAVGHEVSVLSGTLEVRAQFETSVSEHRGLRVTRFHRSDLYFDAWDKGICPPLSELLRRELLDLRPDVVHLHHWIRLSKDIAETAADAGFPVVVTLHDFASSCPRAFRMHALDDAPCYRPLSVESCLSCVPRWPWNQDEEVAVEIDWFRRLSLSELSRANRLLCASQSVLDTIASGLDLPLSQGRVLPLSYHPRFESRLQSPRDQDQPFTFGYWGAVTHRKGLPLLLRAFRDLLQGRDATLRPLELEIFGAIDKGEGELDAEIRELAANLPVRLHGRFEYDQIEAAKLDAAVFPSLCLETYGLVLDEAFELGLPVVVTDAGALGERAGDAGVKFRIQDQGDLTRALGAVADDPDLYRRLMKNVPGASMSASDHLGRISDIYQEALEEGPLPAIAGVSLSESEKAKHAFQRQEFLFRRHLES